MFHLGAVKRPDAFCRKGWNSGQGVGMGIMQGCGSWARNVFRQFPAVPCGLEKVPSESIRDPWLSLDCFQDASAVLKLEHRQDAECSQWICREKRWLLRS